MAKPIRKLLKDRQGATSIEYGVMAALVAVAMMTGADMLGSTTSEKLAAVASAIDSPNGSPPPGAAPPAPDGPPGSVPPIAAGRAAR